MIYSKKCTQCKKKFTKPAKGCSIKRFIEKSIFCSKICSSKSMMDKAPRVKACLHCKKEVKRPKDYGNVMWTKRKYCSKKCDTEYRKLNLSANDPKWKGDKVGYRQLHAWIQKHKGTPETCTQCGKTGLKGRAAHWANIDGRYRRELDDYIRLCVKCHSWHDRSIEYLATSKLKFTNLI